MSGSPPVVLSISSHVAAGSVGNRAIVFALETLGLEAWAVNTVSLPFHPGHGPSIRIVPDAAGFAACLDALLDPSARVAPEMVLTGYFASREQVEVTAARIGRLKSRSPEVRYLCDPVIGDSDGLYVAGETAGAIRDLLLPLADIATPNLHELAWLAGEPAAGAHMSDLGRIASMARMLRPAVALVTSAPGLMRGAIGNLLVNPAGAALAEHPRVKGPPNGSGDLTAGLFAGHLALRASPSEALERTTASVFELVSRAAKAGARELILTGNGASILRPNATIALRSLAPPKTRQ